MSDPTYAVLTEPEPVPPEARAHDPLAVAFGNASLLGVGYLMMRRRKLATVTALVTVVLVSMLTSTDRRSYEVAVLLWWAAVIAHGWFLARRGAERVAVRSRRLVALAVTLPVLLAVGLLRFDASRIGQSVTEARETGDCAEVLSAQGRVWLGHRIADAPLSARGDGIVRACNQLQTAGVELTTALTGDTDALEEGFGTLASVLTEPGNEKTVEATLNGLLGSLPAKDACDTVAVTDWLRDRKRSHDVLDRSADAVKRTAPAALVGCGDDHLADSSWEKALTHYEQLLDQYPGNGLADKARKGSRQATQSIELANVRSLLFAQEPGSQPEYCSSPAKYSGAKPIGKGTNRALFYGGDEYSDHSDKLPGSWKTDDPAVAVLVVCMGEQTFGTSVQTCPYKAETSGSTTYVAFSKIAIPVKVYELRTGKLVANRKIQIDGTSCPATITYFTRGDSDSGPPSARYVDASKSDVRAAFRPLVIR
ncbi:tol-pal system YbgF family protein [Streptomyces sp. NPDC091287]|uniref:tetratricopeptide repeat protein n=1 Tax=Streptomyces sp. NPDC091287 TaxID=3365988 RepID=UPI0037FD439D